MPSPTHQPRNRLPKEENERIIREAMRRMHAVIAAGISLSDIEGGSAGAGSGFPLALYTPIVIAATQTFTVPTNCQVLYTVPMEVDGQLVIDGELANVD